MKTRKNKAQLKIQQMAFMLLGVVLFFLLVVLIWISLQSSKLSEQSTLLKQDQAVLLSQYVSDSTEFSCSSKSYCIDTDKLMVLLNKSVYSNFWPVSYIKIRKVFPKQEQEKSCNVVNYPDCNTYNLFDNNKKSSSSVGSYIALCRYEKNQDYVQQVCEIGKIIIGYEVN